MATYNQRQSWSEAGALPLYQPPMVDQSLHTPSIPKDNQVGTPEQATTNSTDSNEERRAWEPIAPPPIYQGYQLPTAVV
ncbi:hypothetical protein DL93DRAFT_2090557 [Clavulina sp. PMI_390]|nr:hypothetical protein DL93DRAFT_2090557 [Clavulina sp. PMI_390]